MLHNSIASCSQVRKFFAEEGGSPRKSLSQSFLIHRRVVKKFLSYSALGVGDCVLEIGPGLGAITEQVLEHDLTLFTLEKDERFAPVLSSLGKKGRGVLHPLTADACSVSLEEILLPFLEERQGERKKAKMVANLPFQSTAPLLHKILPLHSLFSSCSCIIQREVAERIVAPPVTRKRSSFSLFCQLYSQPKYLFSIPPQHYYPRPKVDTAAIHFRLKNPLKEHPFSEQLSPDQIEKFLSFVRTAFRQKRKMLRSSLSSLYPREKTLNALRELVLLETARPEELSLSQFFQLFFLLHRENIS